MPADDQENFLKHFVESGNGWLDAATFARQQQYVPAEYQNLLGDANGPKST